MQGSNENIRKTVREEYGKVAFAGKSGCCSTGSCCQPALIDVNVMSIELGYNLTDVTVVPEGANMGLGCGNPQAIASIREGETVLDLGSGGGFDCFLAAKAVGETGQVIGVDMTPAMVDLARSNAEKGRFDNVEFRLGEIEHLPVAENTIDVIISNCVINLSPEKEKVFQESFRVLKPGGRLAISDVVATVELPAEIKTDMSLYTECISGASPIKEVEAMLITAGFIDIQIKPKDESKQFIEKWAPNLQITDYVISATIQAIKP